MIERNSSSPFTNAASAEQPFGPPLIGALLRMPWEAVQRHMLQRLHERGFSDFDAAYLNVFQYPGPQGARPSELAARLRISKQALGYLLRQLEQLGYLERRADPHRSEEHTSELQSHHDLVCRLLLEKKKKKIKNTMLKQKKKNNSR